MTLHDHISLEQVQGMIENEREATTLSFAIDYMSENVLRFKSVKACKIHHNKDNIMVVCSIETIKLNSSTNKSGW